MNLLPVLLLLTVACRGDAADTADAGWDLQSAACPLPAYEGDDDFLLAITLDDRPAAVQVRACVDGQGEDDDETWCQGAASFYLTDDDEVLVPSVTCQTYDAVEVGWAY